MAKEKVAVMVFDYEGNYLQDFASVTECSEYLKVEQPEISMCLSGSRLSVKGFQFRKRHSNRTPQRIGDLNNSRSSTCIVGKYWNDRLIATYPSQYEAAERNRIEQGNVSESINKGWKVNGFNYKKLN